jgi:hypothetical protein
MGGSDKQTNDNNSQTKVTATPEETALNQLNLQRAQASQAGTLANDQSALTLQGNLMRGESLPGYLNTLTGGIDTNAQNSMANSAVKTVNPYMNQGGIMDSGTAASIGAKAAQQSYQNSQEFNIQNLMQLMNLATGNAAQNQSGMQSTSSQLSNSLAGLRTTSSNSNTTYKSQNPFIKSFEQSSGQSLGKGLFFG